MPSSGLGPSSFLCVHCGAVLAAPEATQVTCAACGKIYPMLLPGIPVLIDKPDDHFAMEVAEILETSQYTDSVIQHQEAMLAAGCKRPAAVRRLLDVVRTSSVQVKRLLSMLPPRWPLDQLMKPRTHPISTRLSLQHLVRDWGGRPRVEATLGEVMAAIRRQLAPTSQRDTVLVLGAGTGRYAWELTADFAEVLALDWSIASVLSYALVAQGPVELHEANEQNVATIEDIGVPVVCEIPPRGGPPDRDRLSRLRWMIADGRNAPLAGSSCSAVLSIYFSDLVLPGKLVDEAWRLLRPGGAFVHFGPLGYEHGNFDEMLTAEELCALFAERGFHVTPCEWVPHLYWSAQRLVQAHMNAFTFAAVKPAAP